MAYDFDAGKFLGEVADYLVDTLGVGTKGQDVFLQQMPAKPAVAIIINWTGGPNDPSDPTKRRFFQILIRHSSESGAFARTVTVFNGLRNKWNILPSFPGRIVPGHEIGPHWNDESGQPTYSLNFAYVSTEQ